MRVPPEKNFGRAFARPARFDSTNAGSAGNDVDARQTKQSGLDDEYSIPAASSICLLARTARTDGEKNKSEGRVLSRVQATAREASARSSSDPTPSCLSDATIVRGDPRRRTPRSSASPRVGPESWVSSPRTSRPIRRTSSWRRCVSARSRASVGFEPGVTTWRLLRSFALVRGSTRARSTFDASRLPRPVARPRRLDVDDAHVPDASPNPDRALPSPSDVTPVPTPPLPSAAPVRRRRATT